MRTLKQLTFFVWIVAATAGSLTAQDRIPWVKDLQTARQMAQQQRRLVLLHFWTETCLPCQRLERYVFNQPELIRAVTTGYIPVKINAQEASDLAQFYKIVEVPTDIIVDPNGQEIYRANSPQDSNQYIAMLDGVKAHHSVGHSAQADMPTRPPTASALPPRSTSSQMPPNYSPRSSGFGLPADRTTQIQTNRLQEASSQPPAAPSMVQNPYGNPLQREMPQQPASSIAPAYGDQFRPAQGSTAATQTTPGPSLGQGAAAASPGATGDQFQIAAPAWAANGTSTTNGTAANRQPPAQSPPQPPALASASRPWQESQAPRTGAFGGNTMPSQAPATSPPTAPRVASRAAQPQLDPPQANAGQPPLAMDGFCAVSLVERTAWAKGDPRFGIVHRGRLYLFSSQQDQQRFWSNPERFSPALSGFDAVRYAQSGQLVPGKREHGVFYRDRIYLFADETALQQFGAQPDQIVALVEQAQEVR